jgi:hypothetical protein
MLQTAVQKLSQRKKKNSGILKMKMFCWFQNCCIGTTSHQRMEFYIFLLYRKVFTFCFVKTLLQHFSDFVISRKLCVVDTLGFSNYFLKAWKLLKCTQNGSEGSNVFYKPILKAVSHEIFRPVFWSVWMYLGLNGNRLWFLNFNGAPLILDNFLKFGSISGKT